MIDRSMPSYSLRHGLPDDLKLIWLFQKESMRPHVEAQTGFWDEEGRRKRILSSDPQVYQIIEVEGRPAGCCQIQSSDESLRLVRLYLLPSYQNQGIGSAVVRDLCDRADTSCLPVHLRVYKVNRAKRLYEKFSFVTTDETDTHYYMTRQPKGEHT